ncbi:7536_t:CDS:1, partial [Funneliformis geosporum]
RKPRTRPDFINESCRFQVQIRGSQYINPNCANDRNFQNI